jgi:hypothetical protein
MWHSVSAQKVSNGVQIQESLQPPQATIPLSLFGMHFHRLATTTPWPENEPIGNWRLLAAYVDWPNLEPSRDKYDFEKLDLYLKLAEQHHVTVILPLVLTPNWASSRPNEPSSYAPGNAAEPKDMADWRDFVRTVGTRYKGRIHEFEIWNEPNLKEFYSGSIPQLVEMARIAYTTLKEIDPSNTVSSPPITSGYGVSWLDSYLKAGGKNYADVIGYHLYVNPKPPELMVPLIKQVKAVMQSNGIGDRPFWNTESGWAIQNAQSAVTAASGSGFNSTVLPLDVASAYVARAYILSWASGVSRFYWYAWDDGIMGLTEADGKTLKPPAIAYREVENWLVGSRMTTCGADQVGNWTCQITRDSGYRGWIVWNPDHSVDFHTPNAWEAREERNLSGTAQKLAIGQSIQIGQAPVLIQNSIQ